MVVIKKIFLTGATGFLGSNLLQAFVTNGYEVTILIREKSNLKRIDHLLSHISLVYLEKFDIDSHFGNASYDLVIHTAANYGRDVDTIETILEPNLLLPLNLLIAAISTGVNYFINTDTSLPRNINRYALSKKQFNEWLQFYSDKITVINIELEYFYGSGDDQWKFINSIIHKFLAKAESIDFSVATQQRDFIYIEDVVSAYLLLIKRINAFEGFNNVELGSGKAYTLKDIIVYLHKMCNSEFTLLNFGALPTRTNEVMYSMADTTVLLNIGWNIEFTLEEGLFKTIEDEKLKSYGTN
jgi:nucleoside-diphosphate-sugar epimerase